MGLISEKELARADQGKPWGISPLMLRPVRTKSSKGRRAGAEEEEEEVVVECSTTPTSEEEVVVECSTTPTSEEARIPAKRPCPPAPKKNKPPLRCQPTTSRDFFCPPDPLETVFTRRPAAREISSSTRGGLFS